MDMLVTCLLVLQDIQSIWSCVHDTTPYSLA